MSTVLTWEVLAQLEPGLLALEREIKAVKDNKRHKWFCANWVWYREPNFRKTMIGLVGWAARKDAPILKSREAYHLAYEHLYYLLPECRNCICA